MNLRTKSKQLGRGFYNESRAWQRTWVYKDNGQSLGKRQEAAELYFRGIIQSVLSG